MVYADFESILERHYGCQPDPNKSSTIKLAKHVPSGFTYKVVGVSPETTENHVTYRGEDAVEKFMDHMVKLEEKLVSILRNPKPMNLSDQESESFLKATHCCICKDQLGNDTVRDHCHVTGKFRGAAHSSCNLNLRLRERIPVFFHNLKDYDAHHIMSVIGKYKHKRINCIPQNHEKYIAFSLGNLDFVDTFQFMSTSLEKLSINLAKEGLHKFPHLEAYVTSTHPGNKQMKLQLLSRKGVYPYRYINSFKRFEEKALSPQKAFFNDLDGKTVSDQEFHAQLVWDVFKIQDLGLYHDLYMETDVHLLADVFENFRSLCLEMYGLDAAYFYTAPGLA